MKMKVVVSSLLIASLALGEIAVPNKSGIDLLIQKAHSLEGRGRADLAAQVWQQVLIADPNQVDALVGLARWAKQSGKAEEANNFEAKLRKLSPGSLASIEVKDGDSIRKQTVRLNEAAKLAGAKRFEAAMQIYQDVFGSNPPAGGWALAYYETESQTGNGLQHALNGLRKLAQEYPDVDDYKIALGRILTCRSATRSEGIAELASVGDGSSAAAKAKQAWRDALLWERSNSAYLPAIHAFLSRYPDAELQAAADSLGRLSPTPSALDEQRGYQALNKQDVEAAKQHFTAALQTTPRDSKALSGLGYAHMQEGNFAAAVSDFEKAKTASPKSASIAANLEDAKFWSAMERGNHFLSGSDALQAALSFAEATRIRPNDSAALQGAAGAYLKANQPADAIPFYNRLTQLQPDNADIWISFIRAQRAVEGAKSATELLDRLPLKVLRDLQAKPDFRILQAGLYADTGRPKMAIDRLAAFTPADIDRLTPDAQVELASIQVRSQLFDPAASNMRRLLIKHSDNLGAWSTLIGALVSAKRISEAEAAIDQMPESVKKAALDESGFLLLLASTHEASGNYGGSKLYLDRFMQLPDNTVDDAARGNAKLLLASVLGKLGQVDEAQTQLESLVSLHPENAAAWKAYFLLLQNVGRSREELAVLARTPDSVLPAIRTDGDVVSALADAEMKTGHLDTGVQLLGNYVSQNDRAPRYSIQLCWMLLNDRAHAADLYSHLAQLGNRTDLDAQQSSELSRIWTTWILRTAQSASKAGNDARAEAILTEGVSRFPQNAAMQSALAGKLLQMNDSRRALAVYSNWGLQGASSADYAGAVGAALQERNTKYADAWLEKGLNQWPVDPQLLTLAGDRFRSKGDVKKAKQYWHEALLAKQATSQNEEQGAAGASVSDTNLRALLIGADPRPEGMRRAANPDSSSEMPAVHLSALQQQELTPASADDFAPPANSGMPPAREQAADDSRRNSYVPSGASSLLSSNPSTSADNLEDKIAKLENRNAPYLNAGTTVQSRSGQGGFDRLFIEQANFEASTTIADQMRVSLIAKPTYLTGGSPAVNSTVQLGTAALGSSFAQQGASGIAAETQLSTDTFGVRLGMSPSGFLVQNAIGGVRFQPANGPITVLLERDSVRDTLLSFAGTKDPMSGQVLGGVVSSGASVLGHWGDDRSGLYASIGYADLTGKRVQNNDQANGNLGVYWKAWSGPASNLTLGLNFSAMHYERNLRYFTTGQGGYFSPQQYYLFGLPFRYTGTYNRRLQYAIGGSFGVQHFEENASEYFPLDAALQLSKAGGMYPAFQSTGANFSFDARVNYQINPQLFLGAYLTANNARNYVSSGAGLFIKYSFEPKPNAFDEPAKSVPDWRGVQPFSLF